MEHNYHEIYECLFDFVTQELCKISATRKGLEPYNIVSTNVRHTVSYVQHTMLYERQQYLVRAT